MHKYILLLFILLSSSETNAQTFREMQLRCDRVSNAYQKSDALLREKFESAGVSYPPKYIYWRAFKTEKELELWASDDPYKPHKLIDIYSICRLSGVLGFKAKEGDEQIPEGCYYINRFNAWSNYFLSFRLSYPNGVDSFWGSRRSLGGQIYVHGQCETIGCLPMTDSVMSEIYWASVQAKSFQGFTARIPIHVFPFRPENMLSALADDAWAINVKSKTYSKRWKNLFFAYHHFERAHFPARARHDNKGYYHFDTIPPKIPRRLVPIYWSPSIVYDNKSDTPYEMMKTRRILKPISEVEREYVIGINRKELSSGANFRLKMKYIEIKPEPGENRPFNAPKRFRKVADTVFLKLEPK